MSLYHMYVLSISCIITNNKITDVTVKIKVNSHKLNYQINKTKKL